MNDFPQPDATLDCTGLFCPQPVIRTAARIKDMQPGQILEVRATDPGFQIDLPAWCLGHRHEFLGIRSEEQIYLGYVRIANAQFWTGASPSQAEVAAKAQQALKDLSFS